MFSKQFDFETEDYNSLTSSQLKKMADYWLRKYLLKIVKRNGLNKIYCPIKEKYYDEKKMNASHFIDRSCMHLRYDLNNVHLISEQSNVWDSKVPVEGYKSLHHKEYEEWLGEKKVKILERNSKNICIFAKEDYIRIIKTFKNE